MGFNFKIYIEVKYTGIKNSLVDFELRTRTYVYVYVCIYLYIYMFLCPSVHDEWDILPTYIEYIQWI